MALCCPLAGGRCGADRASGSPAPASGIDGSVEGSPDAGGDIAEDKPVPDAPRTLRLSFDRTPGCNDLDVVAPVSPDPPSELSPNWTADWPVALASDRGTLGLVEASADHDGPLFRAHLTPGGTGRHVVTATVAHATVTATRTELVMPSVGEDWNQPEPVGGLVNTAGWEDGANISPDGRWLVVQCTSNGRRQQVVCGLSGAVRSRSRARLAPWCERPETPPGIPPLCHERFGIPRGIPSPLS